MKMQVGLVFFYVVGCVCFATRAGALAQRLGHEARLQTDAAIADFAFDFRLRHQSGHRVDDDGVNGVGANEHIADLKRLFARVRLRDKHLVDIDAEASGIGGIERMLGVNERHDAAQRLSLRENLQGKRGLAAGFRTVDFYDTPARHSPDTQGGIQRKSTGGDDAHLQAVALAQLHDGALTELALNLFGGELENLIFILSHMRSLQQTMRCDATGFPANLA